MNPPLSGFQSLTNGHFNSIFSQARTQLILIREVFDSKKWSHMYF